MSTVRALLIGIDDYPTVNKLHGCVNDVTAADATLRRLVEASGSAWNSLVLTNEQATYDGVIAALHDQLRDNSEPGDTALFYYSGHGSQEDAAPARWADEPDHQDETLVLWDSRTPDHHDLADDKLGALLDEVAKTGARVAVVLDSCHSGDATRGLVSDLSLVRQVPPDPRPRPAESYYGDSDTPGVGRPTAAGWSAVGHVLLAACRADQEAHESTVTSGGRSALRSNRRGRCSARAAASATSSTRPARRSSTSEPIRTRSSPCSTAPRTSNR